MAVLASHPAPTHSQLQPMHIALYIYIHYTYYIIFITYVFESLLFWHLNLMCFFYIYLSTDNVQPIINQTMKLKYGKNTHLLWLAKEVEEVRVDFGDDDGKEEGRRRRRRHRRQMGRWRWKGTPLACSEEWWAGRWRERIPSPRWHLLLLIITMVGDDDFWSWSPCLDDVSFTAPVASIVASSSVRSIVADSERFSISMEGRRGFYSIIA